ncbi:hypothetical protein Goari_022262 [Gossypium aridum]|uniref:Uncharacterized protein n=1 Tax=Gossypium aridum TaxID=34290 RepID=A0A7J8YM12_GOSAI|nr:hypothetical protein [Gossypium aridum]
MGFRLPRILNAKPILKRSLSFLETTLVAKGHFAVYALEVDEKKYLVVPMSLLKHPSFQNFLSQAGKEFSFNHPRGALTIPSSEEAFINLTCILQSS